MKNKKSIIILSPILLFFFIFSIKPLLFTSNFFLYLINKDHGGINKPDKYLIRSLSYNPDAYRFLYMKKKTTILLLTAIVEENPEMLNYLTESEEDRIGVKFVRNLYYRNLKNDMGNGLIFGQDGGLSNFLLSDRIYNKLTFSLIRKLDKESYRNYFRYVLVKKRSILNTKLRDFIEDHFSMSEKGNEANLRK